MYGKIFEDIFKSTVADWGGDTVYTFIGMIVLSDSEGYIRDTASSLSRALRKDIDAVNKALANLEAEDPDSNDPGYNGRRIIPLSELTDGAENRGWWVVNKKKYADLAKRKDRATQSTLRSQKFREKNSNKNNNETRGDAKGRKGTKKDAVERKFSHTDVDVDTDVNIKTIEQNLLPKWVNLDAWYEFEQHRNEIKRPLTNLARVKNLNILEANKDQQQEIIDKSIANRWSGLFPVGAKKGAEAQLSGDVQDFPGVGGSK